MPLIKFEFQRFIRAKSLLLLIVSSLFTIILSITLNLAKLNGMEQNIVNNYYVVLSQFGFLFFVPIVGLCGFSRDYEKKIIPFYHQNNISLFKTYIARNIVLSFASVLIYIVSLLFYILFYSVSINVQIFYIFIFLTFIIIYNIQIGLLISIVCKKITTCMMIGVSFWVCIHIAGLATKRIPIISGKASLIDGNSYYAEFLMKFTRNMLNTFPDFLHGVVLGLFWIVLPIIIGSILIKLGTGIKNAL